MRWVSWAYHWDGILRKSSACLPALSWHRITTEPLWICVYGMTGGLSKHTAVSMLRSLRSDQCIRFHFGWLQPSMFTCSIDYPPRSSSHPSAFAPFLIHSVASCYVYRWIRPACFWNIAKSDNWPEVGTQPRYFYLLVRSVQVFRLLFAFFFLFYNSCIYDYEERQCEFSPLLRFLQILARDVWSLLFNVPHRHLVVIISTTATIVCDFESWRKNYLLPF